MTCGHEHDHFQKRVTEAQCNKALEDAGRRLGAGCRWRLLREGCIWNKRSRDKKAKMTDLSAGSQLGRYELLVRIGHGGMASVWVARLRSGTGQDRLVAIKAMLPELAQDSSFRAMFLDEVQIVRSIDHENVVRVYEVSEDQGILYMVMEWVEGDSLRNLIRQARRRAAIPSEIAVRIVADTAAGLHAAHELRGWDGELRRVVHCDVSPHNILVGIDGMAKVVDFGIASAMGTLDSEGVVRGKLGYMSPEQALGEHLDRRSDTFSLGVVLYELATGEQLFKGRDAEHTLDLVRYAQVPPPSRVHAGFPKALEPIVLRSLERDPAHRFQTALEFQEALDSYLTSERILVSHAAVAQLLLKVVGERIRKRRDVLEAVADALDNERQLDATSDPGVVPDARIDLWSRDSNTDISRAATSTGSEISLGVAAKLQDTGAATTLAHPSHPSFAWRPRVWPWIGLGVFVTVAGALTYWRLAVDVPLPVNTMSDTAKPSAEAAPDPVRTTPPAETRTANPTLSLDALPVSEEGSSAFAGRPRTLPMLPRPSTGSASTAAGDQGATQTEAATPPHAARATGETSPKTDEPEIAEVSLTPSAPEVPPQEQTATPDGSRPKVSPFDRSAARAALASAAATTSSCGGQGPPAGAGSVTITFRPDGGATGASVSQKFLGTPVGNCVLSKFRGVRVPAFAGLPVTMTQSFTVPD